MAKAGRDALRRSWPLDGALTGVNPHLSVNGALVGRLPRANLAVFHGDGAERRSGPCRDHAIGILLEARAKRQVEDERKRPDRQGSTEGDDDDQPVPKPDASHLSR